MSNEYFVQVMGDNQLLKGDVSQAAQVIRAMFNEKYIYPIKNAIEKESKKVRKNPGKEARLLSALKPFIGTGDHKALDDTINALHLMETLRGLSHHIPKPRPSALTTQELSMHPDGIYDIDERCMSNKTQNSLNPIFMMMFMMSLSKNT